MKEQADRNGRDLELEKQYNDKFKEMQRSTDPSLKQKFLDELDNIFKQIIDLMDGVKEPLTEEAQGPSEDEFNVSMGIIGQWARWNVSAQSTSDIGDALRKIRYTIGRDRVYNKED